MHELNKMSFGWCFIICIAFWKHTCFCGFLWIFWSWIWSGTWTFSFFQVRKRRECIWKRVSGWDVMSKGGMEIWHPVWDHHPLGKGEATCHSSLCTNYAQRICGKLLQEVMEEVENTLLIEKESCMWPFCVTIFYWSSDLLFLTSGWCHWSVLTSDCGIWISSTSYSGFDLSLVWLIAWADNTYIGLALELFITSSTLRRSFSPSDDNTAINSWRRV